MEDMPAAPTAVGARSLNLKETRDQPEPKDNKVGPKSKTKGQIKAKTKYPKKLPAKKAKTKKADKEGKSNVKTKSGDRHQKVQRTKTRKGCLHW